MMGKRAYVVYRCQYIIIIIYLKHDRIRLSVSNFGIIDLSTCRPVDLSICRPVDLVLLSITKIRLGLGLD